eukprot:TRINITY_DN2585_c0_g1_i1.p1 TRINITY_DN2585_c0_g1~~TRINITY_DN2585_c0_g1_i1.p1  ORF type:complete len:292 (-),score=85.99 TRINITY_DN2585_c0_g1_i1:257-1132(-)
MSVASSPSISPFTTPGNTEKAAYMTITTTQTTSQNNGEETSSGSQTPLQNSSSSLTPQITSLSITINSQTPLFSFSPQIPAPNPLTEAPYLNLNDDTNNLNNLAATTTSLTNTNTNESTTTSTTTPNVSDMNDESRKKHLRKMQNRQSAAQYRERKKDYLEKLENIVKELTREKQELTQNLNRLTKETNEANFKLCVLEAKLEMEIQENEELREELSLPKLPEFPPLESFSLPANYFIPNFIPPNFTQPNPNQKNNNNSILNNNNTIRNTLFANNHTTTTTTPTTALPNQK